MCEYCNRRIHAPGCPNALRAQPPGRCDYCKDTVTYGETFLELDEQVFHKGCFFDYIFSIHEDDVLDMFGLQTQTRDEAENGDGEER